MCAGKAGLSSTSQQLQLLQQVQQAQHLHAVMGHIHRRGFPLLSSPQSSLTLAAAQWQAFINSTWRLLLQATLARSKRRSRFQSVLF
jgi:hypothetical protein